MLPQASFVASDELLLAKRHLKGGQICNGFRAYLAEVTQ